MKKVKHLSHCLYYIKMYCYNYYNTSWRIPNHSRYVKYMEEEKKKNSHDRMHSLQIKYIKQHNRKYIKKMLKKKL